MNFLLQRLLFIVIILAQRPLVADQAVATSTEKLPCSPSITINMPPMNIELNNQNASACDSNSSLQSQLSSYAWANNKTLTTTSIVLISEIQNSIKVLQAYGNRTSEQLQQWFFNNKWRVLVNGALGIYIYIWYCLLYLSYCLADPNAWHSYKAHRSLDDILKIKQEEFAEELIPAIQRKYAPSSGKDFFIPFTLFTKDIEKEIGLLECLIKLYKQLHLMRIRWLFPWRRPTLEKGEEKLRRILYMRNVAFAWLGTFKFEKYTQLTPEHIFKK